MKGQWVGKYSGTSSGEVIINVDEVDEHYEMTVYILPFSKELPSSIAFIKTENKNSEQDVKANVSPLHPETLSIVKWEDIKALYRQDIVHSKTAIVKLQFKSNELILNAKSDIGIEFNAHLSQPKNNKYSIISGKNLKWDEYKKYVTSLDYSKHMFRGQNQPWKLSTAFHRRGRYRFDNFLSNEIPSLHKKMSSITNHYLDLSKPEEYGAFVSLLQHHGYPTPLLDWTLSPYVAAFFAFRNLKHLTVKEENTRIFIFDYVSWHENYERHNYLERPFLHFSVMDFIPINNPRLIPQQAKTTITNVSDIEEYLQEKERVKGLKFIRAIDIDISERNKVMRDLRYMGITAGTMFPGFDGICEEMRELYYDE